MPNIDDKVVSMSFENSKFESGVKQSLTSIEKLKAALHFPDAGKSLVAVGHAAHQIDLGHIAKAADEVSNKLNALRIAAVAVFVDIARRAVAAGASMVKALTIDPIKTGFQEYSTQLNSVQTILANTQAAGVGLKEVNATLKELNEYSDKTIYNFGQMARNIGTFTAAGVELKTATASIKGIANLAALSGSNAEQASTAMYQLSQAIAAGSVKLMDWNSVVNAGMGGTVFQRALAQTGEAMGTLEKGAVRLSGPMKNVKINGEAFRQSLSVPGKASWLTSDVLTTTLKQFTGDLKDSELAAMGFSKAQIKSIQATAKTAMHAATEVKTIKQAFDVAKETAGSGWAQTFQIVFGTFTEAKKTFTEFSETINGFINANADARNKVLADWKKLGGRTVLIDGIKTAFHNLAAVIKPIKDAFRDIFPAITGKNLYDLTVQFRNFTKMLKPSPETVENLRRTFRGLFAVLDIGKEIIFGVFGVLRRLFGEVGKGSGGFLSFTAAIGDALVSFHDWLIEGGRLSAFFDKLGSLLSAPIDLLKALATALSDAFSGFSSGGLGGQISGITEKLSPLQRVMEGIAKAWDLFLEGISNSGKVLQPIIEGIVQVFQALGPAISGALSSMNFEAILAVVRTGLFAGLVLMFKQFLGKGSGINQLTQGFGKGILGSISGSMRALQGNLVAMQNNVKADTLKKIAIAVALLAVSVLAISMVDPKRLNASLGAMTVMFGQLLGAMAVMEKIATSKGFLKMPVITFALIGLAIAIDALAIAVIALSRLSWQELLKGLAGVAVSLGILLKAVGPLSANSPGMIRAGIGLMAIAIALRIMANAVQAFGDMDLMTLGKGLGAVAVSVGIMVAAMNKTPLVTKGLVSAGASLILLAVGLRILAEAVQKFGGMDMATLGKGLGSVAASLLIIGVAMRTMPKDMIKRAVGLVIVAAALQLIAKALQTMGGMSVEAIAKSLITLCLALMILQAAMIAMEETLPGAVALAVVAGGVLLLANALNAMGSMSWESIIKSLVLLAAAFTVIGVAAALITPVIPSLLGFGIAIGLIGAGLFLAGAGIGLLAAGLAALVVAAPTGFGVILAAFVQFQEGIIENAKLLVLGVLEIVQAFADTAPQFVDSIVKILSSVIDGLIKIIPKLVPLIDVLITAILDALANNQDRIIQAGMNLIIALLQGIRNYISQIAQLAVEIIANFIDGIAKNIRKIVDSGVKLIVTFLKGIASGYSSIVKAGLSIITKFLGAIASNIGKIVTAGGSIITKFLKGIANNIGKVAKAATDIIVAFINGVGNAGPRIVTAATNAIIKFINALSKNGVKLANAGLKAVVDFLNGVADAIDTHGEEVRNAGIRIGKAIVGGMVAGLGDAAQNVYNKAREIAEKVVGILKKVPFVSSPSKVTYEIGQNIALGLALGMSNSAAKAYDSAAAMSTGVITAVNDTFQTASPSKVMEKIGRFVTQGFAQGMKRGTITDVKGVLDELNRRLKEAMGTAKATIKAEQAKLKDFGKQDTSAIKKANKVISDNQELLRKLTSGHNAFTKALKANKSILLGLAKDYTKVAERLKAAGEQLKDAIQEQKDAVKDFFEQYRERPDITLEDDKGKKVDPVTQFISNLTKQVGDTTTYGAALKTLEGLGLDEKTLEKLIREGPTAANLAFATGLVKAGAPAIATINALAAQLDTVSQSIADSAGVTLYQGGIDTAQELIRGLTEGIDGDTPGVTKLLADIDKLGKKMVKRLKNILGIKSPSEEFSKIGQFSMEGLAKGFSDSSKTVTNAIDQTADDALTAMQQSMKDISNAVTDEMDTNPTITPVLDLTQVRSQAQELAALKDRFAMDAAYKQASSISSAQRAKEADMIAASGGAAVKFEQNNYSPKALTEVEIYRQTRNQLSRLRDALAVT